MKTSFFLNEAYGFIGDKISSTNGKNHVEEIINKTKYPNRKRLIKEIECLIKQGNCVDEPFKRKVKQLIRNFSSIIGTNGISYSILGESKIVKIYKSTSLYRFVERPTYIGLPPTKIHTYGRLNLPNEHPFYLSLNPYTALHETNYRNLLVFKTNRPIKCSLASANFFKGNQFSNKDRIIGKNISALYNSLFNLPGYNDRVYYITNYLKNNFLDNKSSDAILYPSKSLRDTNEGLITNRSKNRISFDNKANFLLKNKRNPCDFLTLKHDYNIKIVNNKLCIIAENKNGVI